MIKVRSRGEQVRRYILDNVQARPKDIAKVTAEHFAVTRQAVNRHLKNLVDEKVLVPGGATVNRTYKLRPLEEWNKNYLLTPDLAEDVVWRKDVAPALGQLPSNVLGIWQYAFTEMFNNAVDHSAGKVVRVTLERTAVSTSLSVQDDGVGIFKKIQRDAGLLDERHAVLELAKGKMTTDPENHTGEGIFFTSRVVDDFAILSGGTYFSHKHDRDDDWILENSQASSGTAVFMRLSNHTSRTTKKVFDKFTSGDGPAFTKTIVPVGLAQYGDDKLVSRSQAKRLLDRVDRFRIVIFDFHKVESIGQAFADEIFRVFAQKNPQIELLTVHDNSAVQQMIKRARSNEPILPMSDKGKGEDSASVRRE